MQAYLGLGLVASSFDGVPLSSGARLALWPRATTARRGLLIPAAAARGEQNHYAVLGLQRGASAAEIKKAYRLLARKYHPDVSRDVQAGEVFKGIRLAYEVLSDEDKRSQYDRKLEFQRSTERSYRRRYYQPDVDIDDSVRVYRWAELRQQMRYAYYKRRAEASSRQAEDAQEETISHERGPFGEVVWSAFTTLFFLKTVGSRITLTLCAIAAMFDPRLDAGYKMGHMIALLLGDRGGILLSLCISFVSWLFGKNSSDAVILSLLAMWVGVNLSSVSVIPKGAVLVLLYMSMRLRVD